ncbi:MAG TPA: Ni/Fe-hydrogenase cytochrome b subunit, partial [Vicinamibacterales bacterium]|nr:Ni/Fe-hydrogenase cytochrome b subunit [Vicinamibacterales bacterium]
MSRRVRVAKGILWTLLGLAAGVTVVRFTRGLGATTALTDATPWGLWIGFDVMGGVALAAGGFVVAALAHIFHRHRYHHAVRPAILTALLGYGAVVVGLLYDLGLPWNIWHLTIFWNPRSPLFEVGWCVMLYLTVLALEFAPVFLERTPFQGLYRLLLRIQLPLIVMGISLSTLHQSSLGTLILIMPFRVHELWYTSLLPELFFVTAICLGLAMVIFESTITSWLYEREPQTDMVAGLARLAAWALAFQLALRIGDLAVRGDLGLALQGGREASLFLTELLLSSLLPLALFAVPALRRRPRVMLAAAASCVAGFLLHRINASGLAHVAVTGSAYFPSWTEVAVSLGVVSGAALAFLWIQEHFPVDAAALDEASALKRLQLFELPRMGDLRVWLGDASFGARRAYSLAFALAMALGLTLTPWEPLLQASPITRARGGDVLRVGYPSGTVAFPHASHVERTGPKACGTCHHANKPGDTGTPCSECHADLNLPTRVFAHQDHVAGLGGNASCAKCHDEGRPRSAAETRACSSCHPAGT